MTKSFAARLVLPTLVVCSSLALVQAQGLRPSPGLQMPGLAAGSAANKAAPQTADFIVAVVNSEPITNNEVRSRLFRIEQQMQQQGQALPPRRELVQQVLERLINDRAQTQAARASGLRVDDVAVDGAIEGIAQQNQLNVEGLRRQLTRDGLDYTQFRAELRDEMLLGRFRQREVDSRMNISEQEVDRFLREQQPAPALATASAPQSASSKIVALNLAEILVPVPENANAVQIATLQAKAQQIFDRARQPNADFAALVRETATAGRVGTGGETGLRPVERLPTLFVEATQNLQKGEVASPVKSGAGFHILKVLEKQLQGGSPASSAAIVQNRARHILLRTGPQLSQQAAIARLADYKKRIQAGQASFATLARDHSDDGSAKAGGELGWANPGMFVPEFEAALDALNPGQIADPVVSRFGVHLIELQERREAKLTPREQREAAKNILRERKAEEAAITWAQDIRGRAYVEMREAPRL